MISSRLALLSAAALVTAVVAAPRDAVAARKCPDIYQPVCAVAPNGANQTYPNACSAHAAHARVLAPGQCLGPICMFIVDPVCARNPVTHRPEAYSNLCLAEVAHAALIHKGACK